MRTKFNQLSRDLAAAIDTGNADEVAATLAAAEEALQSGEISLLDRTELEVDASVAGYDL